MARQGRELSMRGRRSFIIKKKLQVTNYELQGKIVKEITNYKLRITKQKNALNFPSNFF
jgi:hypothetical protein